MKLISWNVNGLRACAKKGFMDFFKETDADFFCVQETKMLKEQNTEDFAGYNEFWNSAVKKGYSGTAIFAKENPIEAAYSTFEEKFEDKLGHNDEGRVICLEYAKFYLVNVYTPNSKRELLRLPYREEWEDSFRKYLKKLNKKKPVIVCGDLNVAHKEIDLTNPASNRKNPGFSDSEREKMSILLDSGFTDTFRKLHPDTENAYTWWSYMSNAREKNIGWRIDYFLVSNDISSLIKKTPIFAEVFGSDHCPIGLEIDINNT
ncbi:exodeoxyribonuclease III [Clostridia bacterium]|nr:exodeoxyribonuclease III [Clostridia bacterium]